MGPALSPRASYRVQREVSRHYDVTEDLSPTECDNSVTATSQAESEELTSNESDVGRPSRQLL
jgi:hypothetical protein